MCNYDGAMEEEVASYLRQLLSLLISRLISD